MRVDQSTATNALKGNELNDAERAKNNKASDQAKAGAYGQVDAAKTEISSKAKEMAQAKAAATDAADIREAKIAELKRRIANKEYNVKPDAIAERMVKEHFETKNLG